MILEITRTSEGIRVVGEVDMASAPELARAIEEVAGSGGQVVIDFEGVTFMDSTGLRTLLKAATSANGSGPVVLRRPASNVRRVLDISIPGGVPGLEVQG